MDIKDLKQAEEILIKTTQNDDIIYYIENEIEKWNFQDFTDLLDVAKIKDLLNRLYEEIFQENQSNITTNSLKWVVFDRIHDVVMADIKTQFSEGDKKFFEKCKILADINVSAEQFGADENYSIPLAAAIVELSVLDNYKNPTTKMNCLCSTYDLVFAELKTAMVSIISEHSEKENEIPIIDNRDIIPILMVVIIKSKLVHMFSNLFYIKKFHDQNEATHVMWDIFKSFEQAVDELIHTDVSDLQPAGSKMIKSIDLEQYMKITSSSEEQAISKTLIDEANQRVLNLITQSTMDDQVLT